MGHNVTLAYLVKTHDYKEELIMKKIFAAILALIAVSCMSSLTAPDVLASDLLVSSFYNNQLLRCDQQTGSFITTFAENAALEQPVGMVFGPDGNLYVAGQNSKNVVRFNGQTGEFIDEFVTPGSGGLFLPIFLIFGPDGNLYVVNSGNDSIVRFDGQSGAFIDVFVTAGSGGMSGASGLAFGQDNHLYVTSPFSNEVLRYNGMTGALAEEFVVPPDAMFVLTDIQLLRFHSEIPGVVSFCRLDFIKKGAWMHAYYYVQGIADSGGALFVEKSLKAGLVLAPGTRIKITGFDSSTSQPFGTLIGYLIPSN